MSDRVLPMTTCCNGTGFADFAAVPCPNEQCPAALILCRKMQEARR